VKHVRRWPRRRLEEYLAGRRGFAQKVRGKLKRLGGGDAVLRGRRQAGEKKGRWGKAGIGKRRVRGKRRSESDSEMDFAQLGKKQADAPAWGSGLEDSTKKVVCVLRQDNELRDRVTLSHHRKGKRGRWVQKGGVAPAIGRINQTRSRGGKKKIRASMDGKRGAGGVRLREKKPAGVGKTSKEMKPTHNRGGGKTGHARPTKRKWK